MVSSLYFSVIENLECFWIECFDSLQEFPVNTGVSQDDIPGITLFLLYIYDVYNDITRNLIELAICGNSWSCFLNLTLTYETLWTSAGNECYYSNSSNAIDLKMDGSSLEATFFKILGLSFSFN